MHRATFRDEMRTALRRDTDLATGDIEAILDEAAADLLIREFTGGLHRIVWSGVVLELALEMTKPITSRRLKVGR